MERKQFAAETVAEAYLALLKDRGIERLYVNAGTDFASIVEAYGRQKQSGLDFPEVIVCAHENLAVSMAHGAYLGDGKVQAVMLHTSVGTANAVCGTFSAGRDRIPILLTAGRTPLFEDSVFGSRSGQIHWAQEMFDQAGMLREFVKWDYELRDGVQVAQVVDRALDQALTEPRGPVYLSLPREVLAKSIAGVEVPAEGPALASDPYPMPSVVEELAERLVSARFPVLVTSATGADRSTVPVLGALAERYGIGVVEHQPRFVNVSAAHPLHLGYSVLPLFDQADLLVFLDVDVPWSQGMGNPPESTAIVQTGPDPHFGRYPIRSHRADLTIMATTANLLHALEPALASRAQQIDPARSERIAEVVVRRREAHARSVEGERRATGPITTTFMNLVLADALGAQDAVVSEYWGRPDVLARSEPGTYFGSPPAGGLGWGLPAAVGLQLARPDLTVVATVGDGAYMFANPAACHHAMAMHDLPVLTIINTNRKWSAVEMSARGMYPEGHATSAGELTPFARLDPVPDFEHYAIASGGYGEHVTERSAFASALERALHAVRTEHRLAVLNVETG